MIRPRILRLGTISHACTLTPLTASPWIPLLLPSATINCQITDSAFGKYARKSLDSKFYDSISIPLKKDDFHTYDGGTNVEQLVAKVDIPDILNTSIQHFDLRTHAQRLGEIPIGPGLLSEYGQQICNYLLKSFPSATEVALRARFFDKFEDKDTQYNDKKDGSRREPTPSDTNLKTFQVSRLRSSQYWVYSYTFSRHLLYLLHDVFYLKPKEVTSFVTKLRYHVPIDDISLPSTVITSDQGSISETYRAFVLPIWDELVQHATSTTFETHKSLAVSEFAPIAYRAADKSLSPHHLIQAATTLNHVWIQFRDVLNRDMYEAMKDSETEPNWPSRPVCPQRAYVALGSNLGDRYKYIEAACKEMTKDGILVLRTSSLYETPAMYVEEQPPFINGVCEVETTLSPTSLLHRLQEIEKRLGRQKMVDKGPRNIDLDILLYERTRVNQHDLVIPHKDMLERMFVLKPLCDLIPDQKPPLSKSLETYKDLLQRLSNTGPTLFPLTPLTSLSPINCGSPVHQTRIMAILNLTPDSFSDGGLHTSHPSKLLSTLRSMVSDGATIIDIGGQSTRPNAPQCLPSEELARILPAIQFIRLRSEFDKIAISVDTYRASVAVEAVKAGANIINDVSAGTLDPEMLPTVAKLGCTIILGHMRGNPSTMSQLTDYPEGVVAGVRRELAERVRAAEQAGIFRWHLIVDPGIGFAKTQTQNTILLGSLQNMRRACDELKHLPMCVGVSRKGFIGNITRVESPKERILGTAVCVIAALTQSADIVRVHDVKEMSQVVKMGNAIWRQPKDC